MRKDGIMKHLFKPKIFKTLLAVLVLLLIVKTLWFVIEILWLPTTGIDQVTKKGGKALYYRVKLTPNKVAAPTTKPRIVQHKSSIDEIKLLAIYNASDMTVVAVEYKAKTKVLSRGENINGYVLEGAGSNFATFSKNAKTYKLMLLKGKSSGEGKVTPVVGTQVEKQEKRVNEPLGDVTDAGDHRVIDRSLLEHYANNMDDIYKNIGITELKEGSDLKGFRITFVRKDSPFEKLGVQRDDVIKSINGQEINSYNAAFEAYKNIKNVDNLTLVIQRGKEEKELEYEIN